MKCSYENSRDQKSSTSPKLQEAQKWTRNVNWDDRPISEYTEKHKRKAEPHQTESYKWARLLAKKGILPDMRKDPWGTSLGLLWSKSRAKQETQSRKLAPATLLAMSSEEDKDPLTGAMIAYQPHFSPGSMKPISKSYLL